MRDLSGHSDPVLRVPYLPALGPVHPDAVTAELWAEVVAAGGTGRCLPHDKDRRWGPKVESVLPEAIIRDGDRATVPTLLQRGGGVLKLHHYGPDIDLPAVLDQAAKLAADQGAAKARVVWFTDTPDGGGHTCRIRLKSFDRAEPAGPEHIAVLDDLPEPIRATFDAFAEGLEPQGFVFLAQRRRAGIDDGPILVAVVNDRIVGAIGPMGILPDSTGRPRLLPQYFAVLPDQRGHGHGRALWSAAMRWGRDHGAAYQLLQNELNSPADRICAADGLATLAYVHTASD